MKKTKLPKILEKDVRKHVTTYLKLKGYFVFWNLQGLGCYKGMSDLVAVKKNKAYWIELKRPNGKQSDNQIQFQKDLESHGGDNVKYLLIESLDQIMDIL